MLNQRIPTALTASVHRILLEEWDPIGVREFGKDAQDEYDGYVPGVVGLLVHGADERKIAEHLAHIATEKIGLFVGQDQLDCARRAAALLVAEGERIFGGGGV